MFFNFFIFKHFSIILLLQIKSINLKQTFTNNIRILIKNITDNKVLTFQKISGVTDSILHNILQDKVLPSLYQALVLSYNLRIPLVKLLANIISSDDCVEVVNTINPIYKLKRELKKPSLEDIKQALEQALIQTPPQKTITDIALELKIPKYNKKIREEFPELSNEIMQRYRKMLRGKDYITKKICIDEVRKILEIADSQSPPVSLNTISSSLGLRSTAFLFQELPDLATSIDLKWRAYNEEIKLNRIKILEEALVEEPPPSLAEITSRLDYNKARTVLKHHREFYQKLKQRYDIYQSEQLLIKLKNLLIPALSLYPPISLKQYSKQVKINNSYLARHYPDICKEITRRFVKFKEEASIRKRQEFEKEVRSIIVGLLADRIYPSLDKIIKKLKVKLPFSLIDFNLIIKNIRNEMGIYPLKEDSIVEP